MASLREIHIDTSCGSLLRELQHIWDEVGNSDGERDKILLEIEQECLQVYRRKVEEAGHTRARLVQSLADAEVEISSLDSALGDRSLVGKTEKRGGTLKEQLVAVQPQLEELRKKKDERLEMFAEVRTQIQKALTEISGSSEFSDVSVFRTVSEENLSLKRLDEYHAHLQALQKEKAERLRKVTDFTTVVQDLCAILAIDFSKIVKEVHPSLVKSSIGQSKSISDSTLERLKLTVQSLQQEKTQRLCKLQDLCASMIELWNLVDTSPEEQHRFQHITCVLRAAENELSTPGVLSLDNIHLAEVEVERLDKLKVSKTKELVMKKQAELNAIYNEAHIDPGPDTTQDKIMAIIESGLFDAAKLLASMDQKIVTAKEEALSRREILEKMEKWMIACEEESWLEDYNRDENRYSASRGAHINLKRAERARATIQKLPSLVDALITKTKAWEEEHGMRFLYDGMRLLDILDEHNLLRKEREQERRRLKDQKRLQEQQMSGKEALFGSPNKSLSAKKGLSLRANGNPPASIPNKRLTLGGAMLQTGSVDLGSRKSGAQVGNDGRKDKPRSTAPVNYVALPKEASVSLSSVTGSE